MIGKVQVESILNYQGHPDIWRYYEHTLRTLSNLYYVSLSEYK